MSVSYPEKSASLREMPTSWRGAAYAPATMEMPDRDARGPKASYHLDLIVM